MRCCAVYSPALLVWVVKTTCRSLSVMVSLAFETAPPEESVTVPLILPYTACALADGTLMIENKKLKQTSFRIASKRILRMTRREHCPIPLKTSWPHALERHDIVFPPPFRPLYAQVLHPYCT